MINHLITALSPIMLFLYPINLRNKTYTLKECYLKYVLSLVANTACFGDTKYITRPCKIK